MSKETTLFKWTREDGKYVTIENGKLSAHNADDTVINPETDEAADLFVEAFMVMRTELTFATFNDDEDEDFRIRRTIDNQIDYMMMKSCRNFGMHHGFMEDCMFGWPMGMFGRCRKSSYLNRNNNNGISDKEYFYMKRKAMMEDFREVISKDESGNPKDFERIEYPNPYNKSKHWKAQLSLKTKRMESIDPLTGKRIRNSKKQ